VKKHRWNNLRPIGPVIDSSIPTALIDCGMREGGDEEKSDEC
jgi:hypothetical protein